MRRQFTLEEALQLCKAAKISVKQRQAWHYPPKKGWKLCRRNVSIVLREVNVGDITLDTIPSAQPKDRSADNEKSLTSLYCTS